MHEKAFGSDGYVSYLHHDDGFIYTYVKTLCSLNMFRLLYVTYASMRLFLNAQLKK